MKIKRIIQKSLNTLGYELRRHRPNRKGLSLDQYPICDMVSFLEAVKLRGWSCNNIMDVGAHRADWSRMAQGVFPNSKFCLIEPLREMEEHLISFCKDFQDSTYILKGVGAKKNIKTLTLGKRLDGSSFVPEIGSPYFAENEKRIIDVITIDSLLHSMTTPMPDIIKLDIQGYELEALKGATKTFGHTELFILEVSLYPFYGKENPVLHEVIQFMLERDYLVYDLAGFLRKPINGTLAQLDICFVKKEGILYKKTKQ
ncbi:MAG: FkbM family methyltransferase [Saprospiraceae bacterium]